jgi:hypothetical protein
MQIKKAWQENFDTRKTELSITGKTTIGSKFYCFVSSYSWWSICNNYLFCGDKFELKQNLIGKKK